MSWSIEVAGKGAAVLKRFAERVEEQKKYGASQCQLQILDGHTFAVAAAVKGREDQGFTVKSIGHSDDPPSGWSSQDLAVRRVDLVE